jgi:hypothetical protein
MGWLHSSNSPFSIILPELEPGQLRDSWMVSNVADTVKAKEDNLLYSSLTTSQAAII